MIDRLSDQICSSCRRRVPRSARSCLWCADEGGIHVVRDRSMLAPDEAHIPHAEGASHDV